MRFLGIDFGTKRVGIAISDEEGRLAFPNTILKNDEKLIENIKEICRQKNIEAIVLGESFKSSGDPNEIMLKILSFRDKLREKITLPIYMEKEFFTTVEARRRLGYDGQVRRTPALSRPAKRDKMERGKPVDASAAALILQRYLDKQKK